MADKEDMDRIMVSGKNFYTAIDYSTLGENWWLVIHPQGPKVKAGEDSAYCRMPGSGRPQKTLRELVRHLNFLLEEPDLP